MGLLDKIFGRKIISNKDNKVLPSFWEDDYCQIEIVPKKNMAHIELSIQNIEDLTEKSITEYGFNEIFIRDGFPFPTLNEEFRIEYFDKIFTEKGFEKAEQVRYDGNSIIECSPTTLNAFSLQGFTFFYDCKEDFISNIWVSSSFITSSGYFNKILEALYELGESCEFVLINWNNLELIDLGDRNHIKEYLMGLWK